MVCTLSQTPGADPANSRLASSFELRQPNNQLSTPLLKKAAPSSTDCSTGGWNAAGRLSILPSILQVASSSASATWADREGRKIRASRCFIPSECRGSHRARC